VRVQLCMCVLANGDQSTTRLGKSNIS
jgi:hypothetical protein